MRIVQQSMPEAVLFHAFRLTNNPRKFVGLQAYGIEIVERVPLEVPPHEQTLDYLRTKKEKLGHLLNSV